MTQATQAAPRRRRAVVPSGVLGMMIFVIAELMFFAGLISAYIIAQPSAAMVGWPPPGQPRLPVEHTAINTAVLLLSGVALFLAHRAYSRKPDKARVPLAASILLGAFFVVSQGMEWVALIGEGLTMTSSTHAAFFYLIVGVHGLHAVAALLVLAMVMIRLMRRTLEAPTFWAAQVFWYFVVGLWPILYYQVYLSS